MYTILHLIKRSHLMQAGKAASRQAAGGHAGRQASKLQAGMQAGEPASKLQAGMHADKATVTCQQSPASMSNHTLNVATSCCIEIGATSCCIEIGATILFASKQLVYRMRCHALRCGVHHRSV